MLDDVRTAFASLTRRPTWLRTALLGTLLVATAGAVVPAVLLAGYAARVLRTDRDDPLPGFADVGDLAADGCRLAAVVVAYTALPTALVAVGGQRTAMAGVRHAASDLPYLLHRPRFAGPYAVGSGMGVPAPDPTAVAVVAAGALLGLLASYLGAVAAVRVARSGRVAAGFESAVLATARRRSTAATWLVCGGLLLAGRIAAALLGVVPVVGGLVAAAFTFAAGVAAARLWALRRSGRGAPGARTDPVGAGGPDPVER